MYRCGGMWFNYVREIKEKIKDKIKGKQSKEERKKINPSRYRPALNYV